MCFEGCPCEMRPSWSVLRGQVVLKTGISTAVAALVGEMHHAPLLLRLGVERHYVPTFETRDRALLFLARRKSRATNSQLWRCCTRGSALSNILGSVQGTYGGSQSQACVPSTVGTAHSQNS